MKRGRFLHCLPLLLLLLASCSRDPKSYVDNGNKFFAKAKYKEAAIMYKKALSKDQRYGEAHYRLALADLQLGALAEAVGELRRAEDLQPDNNDAKIQLANIYVFASTQDQKNGPQLLDEASGLADKLLAKDANSYDGHRLAGAIAILKKETKTAVAELQLANQAKPDQAEVVLYYFEALIADKQAGVAEKLARDFISRNKTVAPVYDRLYFQYIADKKLDAAEEILKLKTENNPKSSNFLLQLAAHYALVKRRADMDAVMRRLTDEKQFPDGHLLAGDFYYVRLRENDLAKQQWEAGMAASPKEKAVYQKRLVELYATTGNSVQANQLVDTLLKENPKDTDAIAMHAALMLSSGNRDKVTQAATDLQTLVRKNPTNHLLLFNYARALLAQAQLATAPNDKNAKLEQARLQLEDAIKVRTDFVAARELLARVYLAKPDLPKALQAAEELLQHDQNNLTGHLIRSASLLNLGNVEKAREELDIISRLFPDNPDARYQAGLLAFRDKDFKKADQVFQALYRDSPHDSRGLFGITETLAAQNRLDDAIKALDKAIAAEPDRKELKMARANFCARAQRYDDALATYKELLEKDPSEKADLFFKMGETYRLKGDINLAADAFRKSSQAAPNSTTPLVYLGMILETLGPADQAKAVYEQILKLDPNNALALNNLAYRKAEEGQDLDSALSMAQHARQIAPNATAMADTVGWIYIKKNLSSEAERIFKDLVTKEPANATFHYHYGLALVQKGDKSSARREFETALKNKPSKEETGKIQNELTKL